MEGPQGPTKEREQEGEKERERERKRKRGRGRGRGRELPAALQGALRALYSPYMGLIWTLRGKARSLKVLEGPLYAHNGPYTDLIL